MPKLNLQEATRNMADATIHQCPSCGSDILDEDEDTCAVCEEHAYELEMSYYDDFCRDDEYLKELEAEEEAWRQAEEDRLYEEMMSAADDVTWDWDDPWERIDYNHDHNSETASGS